MPKKQITHEEETQVAEPIKKRTTSISGMLAAETPETQQLLKNVAKLTDVFKTEINEDPTIVAYLIKKINPEFAGEQLVTSLCLFGTTSETDLMGCIAFLQEKTKSFAAPTQLKMFYTNMFNVVASGFCYDLTWNKIVIYGAYLSK